MMVPGTLPRLMRHASPLVFISLLLPSVSVAALHERPVSASRTPAHCRGNGTDRAPLIVLAVRGALTTVRADGGQSCRLTSSIVSRPNASAPGYSSIIGAASNPQPSPGGGEIAFLTTTNRRSHDVWIVHLDGAAGVPRRITFPSKTVDREGLSWSPGGRLLAYHQERPNPVGHPVYDTGGTVVVRRITTARILTVARLPFAVKGVPNAFGFGDDGPDIAWSPDGKRIASVVGFVQGKGYPTALNVGVADIPGGATHTVVIRFPRGALTDAHSSTKQFLRGSYPSGDGLAWTADSRHLVVTTFGRGEGGTLTGLWSVSASGGVAHLFVGTAPGVHEQVPASPAVDGSTHFLFSPNHRRLVVDPDNRFWVANETGAHGRFTNTNIPKTCQLAQYSWLPDSSGLAYVTVCSRPASGFRLNLYSVRLAGKPRLLLTLVDSQQDALDLTPARRCLACGG